MYWKSRHKLRKRGFIGSLIPLPTHTPDLSSHNMDRNLKLFSLENTAASKKILHLGTVDSTFKHPKQTLPANHNSDSKLSKYGEVTNDHQTLEKILQGERDRFNIRPSSFWLDNCVPGNDHPLGIGSQPQLGRPGGYVLDMLWETPDRSGGSFKGQFNFIIKKELSQQHQVSNPNSF